MGLNTISRELFPELRRAYMSLGVHESMKSIIQPDEYRGLDDLRQGAKSHAMVTCP